MKRGDLWVASGGDDAGKPRPVPIIQNDQFGQTGSIAVCSVSSNPADSPLLRVVPSPGSENASRKFVVSWPKGSRPFADTAGSEGSAVYPRQIRGGSISAFSSSLASPDEAQAKIVALQILDSAPTSRPCFTRFAVRWQRNAILRQGVYKSSGRDNLPSFRAEPAAAPVRPRIQTQSSARRSSGPPVSSCFIRATHTVHDRLPPRLALAIRAKWIVPRMDPESPRTHRSRALPRLPTRYRRARSIRHAVPAASRALSSRRSAWCELGLERDETPRPAR